IKDYYGMAWLASQHPDVPMTFNVVPSLLVQLEDYAADRAPERNLRLAAKPAADLDEKEILFLLDESFFANWETMIRPHARYRELLLKRRFDRHTAEQARRDFTTQDILDLQIWATLGWFFPQLLDDDPALCGLVAKGRAFAEEDKQTLFDRQRDVLGSVAPLYRSMQEAGHVELSVSPFYHPILPLLCNMASAREAIPDLPLPTHTQGFADDARVQIQRAVESYREHFGCDPRGMWPSEGSVSEDMAPLVAEAGLRWMATDEGILARSLGRTVTRDADGHVEDPRTLYQPYTLDTPCGDLSVIFRDRYLSDLVGFQYYHMTADEAADDFLGRLRTIADRSGGDDAFVPVILDGENAWEHYPRCGIPFLHALYTRLADADFVRPVTVSDYLEEHPPREKIPRIFPGSWINSDFAVWIGHEEDRVGWQRLGQTRRFLAERTNGSPLTPELSKAWEELYIAEGSDWFWWYGDDRSSLHDAEFDRLFRLHLQNVYHLLGEAPPAELSEPICPPTARVTYTEPTAFMSLEVDGYTTNFFEWRAAGVYRRELDGGVMQKETADFVRHVYFGFSADELYLRVDAGAPLPAESARVIFSFTEPRAMELEVTGFDAARPTVLLDGAEIGRAADGEILEVACSFADLGFRPRDGVRFHVRLFDGEAMVERAPRGGFIAFVVPTHDFEYEMWQV
ncbi:alpha-amylase/alpha-mannosidase, partial [bacterium]|nr:alpha-amylase/alpha-mannosidase [bacterium]